MRPHLLFCRENTFQIQNPLFLRLPDRGRQKIHRQLNLRRSVGINTVPLLPHFLVELIQQHNYITISKKRQEGENEKNGKFFFIKRNWMTVSVTPAAILRSGIPEKSPCNEILTLKIR